MTILYMFRIILFRNQPNILAIFTMFLNLCFTWSWFWQHSTWTGVWNDHAEEEMKEQTKKSTPYHTLYARQQTIRQQYRNL